jgi:predicted nucleotidyltransferase
MSKDTNSRNDTNDINLGRLKNQSTDSSTVLKEKIESAVDLICQLYGYNIITDAYIFGSVSKGTATKESDIDIYLINPIFHNIDDIFKSPLSNFDLIIILENIGVEFIEISRKDLKLTTYQLYKGELFHLLTRDRVNPFMEGIEIKRDICPGK